MLELLVYCLIMYVFIEFQGKLFLFLQDWCMSTWGEVLTSAQQADI